LPVGEVGKYSSNRRVNRSSPRSEKSLFFTLLNMVEKY
jgi:hypothetical protein